MVWPQSHLALPFCFIWETQVQRGETWESHIIVSSFITQTTPSFKAPVLLPFLQTFLALYGNSDHVLSLVVPLFSVSALFIWDQIYSFTLLMQRRILEHLQGSRFYTQRLTPYYPYPQGAHSPDHCCPHEIM